MPQFDTTPIPYVEIGTQAAAVRTAIDAARLSAANSFGGLQKLAIPGPFATDAEANTFGVPDDNLYYRSDGTVRAASHISLDLAFALDKTLTARTGPTPTFSRASSGLFVNANGILVGKTEGTTASLDPTTTTVGTTEVTVTVASGSVVGWLVGQSVSLIVDSNANNAPNTGELWLVGDIVSTTATQLVFKVTSKGTASASATAWTLGYRGARFDHDATGVCKGLLIEESRTNLLARSSEFNTSPWAVSNSLTVSPDAVIAPDGTLTADALIFDNNSTSRCIYLAGSAAVHTFSVWLRADSAKTCVIATAAAGVFLMEVVANLTTVWQRFTVVASNWASGTGSFNVRIANNSTGTSGTIYAWGAQLEAGAFPTSYIPTTSGTAARSADVCSITGADFSSLWSTTGGTFVFEGLLPPDASAGNLRILSSGSLKRWLYANAPGVGTAGEGLAAYDGANTPNYFTNVRTTVKFKIAISVGPSSCRASFNGSNISAISHNGSLLNPVTLLGLLENTSGFITGMKYYKKSLPDAKLQTLTAP